MKLDFDRMLLEENPDAVIVTAVTGVVVYWNKGAESIFGFAQSEVLGKPLQEAIVPEDRLDEYQQMVAEAMNGNRVDFETIRRKRDGSYVHVDVSCRAVRNSAGHIGHILSTQKDVTDLKVLRDAKLIEAKFHDFQSEFGKGSRFTLSFILADA